MSDNDAAHPLDDDFIDRIVEGTLTPDELRAAVLRLDQHADGWKRCAVAFLEAQCWAESFRALELPATAQLVCPSSPSPPGGAPARRLHHRWLRSAVAAAVIAASFAMGWLGHAARPRTAAQPVAPDQPNLVVTRNTSEKEPATTSGTTPAVDSAGSASRVAQPPRDLRPPRGPAPLVTTVAHLRFGPENARAEVPILAGPGINEEWLRKQPPPVSEHGQVVFQRHGYQVDQRRRLITTIMNDGRRVAVPVDQVLIRYTGNQSL
jgi:hypothetical protein